MQKPSTRDPRHAVFDHEQIGRARQHLELLLIVEVGDAREPLLDRGPRSSGAMPANGSTAHTESPCVASRRAMSSKSGRSPPMSGWSTTPARGIPSGRACTAGTSTASSAKCHRLDGHVELTSFAQMTHGGGNLAVSPGDDVHE